MAASRFETLDGVKLRSQSGRRFVVFKIGTRDGKLVSWPVKRSDSLNTIKAWYANTGVRKVLVDTAEPNPSIVRDSDYPELTPKDFKERAAL